MKKLLTLVALTAGIFAFAGEDLKINGAFKQGKAVGIPDGWMQNNGAWAKPFGKVELVAGSKEGEKAMKITNTTKGTHVFLNKAVPVKLGDTVEIQVEVKGKGKGSIGFYNYDSKKWLGTSNSAFTATPEFTEVKKALKVVKFKENVPTKIRLVLITDAKAEITFEGVQAKVVSAK